MHMNNYNRIKFSKECVSLKDLFKGLDKFRKAGGFDDPPTDKTLTSLYRDGYCMRAEFEDEKWKFSLKNKKFRWKRDRKNAS